MGLFYNPIQINFIGEELEALRSGNMETLASSLCNQPAPTEQGGFFVPFLEWNDDISTSSSCSRVTAFKYSSGFDF